MQSTRNRRPKQSPGIVFAIGNNNQLYVRVADSAISAIVVAIDGLSMVVFPSSPKTPYLLVDDVIAWHTKEATFCRGNERKQHELAARAFTAAKEKHAAGAIEMEEPSR